MVGIEVARQRAGDSMPVLCLHRVQQAGGVGEGEEVVSRSRIELTATERRNSGKRRVAAVTRCLVSAASDLYQWEKATECGAVYKVKSRWEDAGCELSTTWAHSRWQPDLHFSAQASPQPPLDTSKPLRLTSP